MRIPIFGYGQNAKSPYVTAKQLTNIYCEQRPEGEKSILVGYGTPGLLPFVDFGDTPTRGGLEFPKNDVAYVVHRGTLWEVNNAGLKTNRGSLLTTTGRVSMEHNGVQVMIVDGTYAYIYDTGTTVFLQVTDADLFANPATVTYLARRFVVSFTGSSRFQWSDIDNGLSWDALAFANAETNPDPIRRVYATNGQLVLEGSETCEFWAISGVDNPAFSIIQGSASEWGIAAVFSIAKYDNTFACLMKNRMGQVMVAQMNGYIPKKISTVDLDSIINTYAGVSDATAYSYMLGGHPMFVISFPSVGFTWLFDGSTGFWTKLKSNGITRHLGEYSFNLVGRTIVADYSNGKLYALSGTTYTDNGAMIEREVVSESIALPDLNHFSIDRVRLDMQVGGGLAGQSVDTYGVNYFYTSTFAATTPDTVASSVLGNIDIRIKLAADNYALSQVLVSKWSQILPISKSYRFLIDSTGHPQLDTSPDGSATVTALSTAVVPVAAGVTIWLRATRLMNNGAGGNTTTFYTSTDGVTWTPLGSPVINAGTTSIFDNAIFLAVGSQFAVGVPAGRLSGKVYKAQVYNGIAGTLVASFNASDGGYALVGTTPTTITSTATGEIWSITYIGFSIRYEQTTQAQSDYTIPAVAGTNPQIGLQVSRDNGRTWGAEQLKPLGLTGQYATRVEWRKLGTPKARVANFKFRTNDPIPVAFVSACINPSD